MKDLRLVSISYSETRAFKPLFFLSKIVGLYPEKEKTIWSCFHSVGILLAIGGLCALSLFSKWKKIKLYSYASVFIFDIVAVVVLALLCITSIINTAFVKKSQFKRLLDSLESLNWLIIDDNKYLAKRQKLITLQIVFAHLSFFSYFLYHILITVQSFGLDFFISDLITFFSEYIILIDIFFICNFAHSIHYKFKALNKSLIRFVGQFLRKLVLDLGSDSSNCALLANYFGVYGRLCSCVELTNDCFGVHIFGILLVGVIRTTYTVYLVLIYGSGDIAPLENMGKIYILLLYFATSIKYMVYIFLG